MTFEELMIGVAAKIIFQNGDIFKISALLNHYEK